jgi:hypothetical protein
MGSTPKKETMPHFNLSKLAAASTLVVISWASIAGAQQEPGTNAPTPLPANESVSATSGAPILREPVIDASTQRSSLPNTPLLVTGTVVLGATYGASAVAAGLSDRDSDKELYYPVVGPWMSLSERDCDLEPCNRKTLGTVLLVGSGVLQGAGALSMLLSMVIPRTTTREWYLIGNEDLVVAPLVGAGEFGATAVGRF